MYTYSRYVGTKCQIKILNIRIKTKHKNQTFTVGSASLYNRLGFYAEIQTIFETVKLRRGKNEFCWNSNRVLSWPRFCAIYNLIISDQGWEFAHSLFRSCCSCGFLLKERWRAICSCRSLQKSDRREYRL